MSTLDDGFVDEPLLRPALAEALAAMTRTPRGEWELRLAALGRSALRVRLGDFRAPAAELAADLLAAGLLPAGDGPRSDWWCPACSGGESPPDGDPCATCEGRGGAGVLAPHTPLDLLAVASLGRDTLAAAPPLAAKVGEAETGEPVATVLWRVFSAADLRALANETHPWGAGAPTPLRYAASATAWELSPHIPHDHMPWWGYRTENPNDRSPTPALVAAYPHLRELMLRDVHVVGASPGRVVLGVVSPRARDLTRRRYA